ncbi:unknown protein [Desulfotalea psychrophila LSv54]|uniref:Uncharacterized protein n=1 Tax=Desulfotalea psychrophila (strain LSv54 / DSM 12343) TaxID=177439 RepID=Q6ALI9_DESPS|nr:unknown protein [Desulfotalea psychrophila LSv54]
MIFSQGDHLFKVRQKSLNSQWFFFWEEVKSIIPDAKLRRRVLRLSRAELMSLVCELAIFRQITKRDALEPAGQMMGPVFKIQEGV